MSEIKDKPKRVDSRTLRRYYEKETGRPVPKGFDIHHIDFDPKNNDISNLVAVPKDLHSKYHAIILRHLSPFLLLPNRPILSVPIYCHHFSRPISPEGYIEFLKELSPVLEEMNQWCFFKYVIISEHNGTSNIELRYGITKYY